MIKTLNAEQFDSKEFRFCIGRLETLARCKEFNVPADYFVEVTKGIIAGLDIAPVATDQLVRYLRCVPLNDDAERALIEHVRDPDRTIYNWKNYRIWLLLAQKGLSSPDLRAIAREVVETRDDDPTRAGASLYLGCCGDKADREFVAARFSNLTTYLGQRSAILAVQELHFKGKGQAAGIRETVAPFVRSDLNGMYSNLKRAGTYVAELEPLSVANFLDLERDYA